MIMTKEEFKKRWESDERGGGITNEDCADCAKAWGLFSKPRIHPIDSVVYAVAKAAGCIDVEDFNPDPHKERRIIMRKEDKKAEQIKQLQEENPNIDWATIVLC